ncbi:unnamed protein product [Ciceribacter sp. T2.26MG-112.2]|nr:unnamed protein product [Ciceribacter naphthalenivorans]
MVRMLLSGPGDLMTIDRTGDPPHQASFLSRARLAWPDQ